MLYSLAMALFILILIATSTVVDSFRDRYSHDVSKPWWEKKHPGIVEYTGVDWITGGNLTIGTQRFWLRVTCTNCSELTIGPANPFANQWVYMEMCDTSTKVDQQQVHSNLKEATEAFRDVSCDANAGTMTLRLGYSDYMFLPIVLVIGSPQR